MAQYDNLLNDQEFPPICSSLIGRDGIYLRVPQTAFSGVFGVSFLATLN